MPDDLFSVEPDAPTPKSCAACEAWAADQRSALYQADCRECVARGLAISPMAWRAVNGRDAVGLREAIVKAFGDDHYEAGRKLVWAWIQRLKEVRR
jgi:hypothetical protein